VRRDYLSVLEMAEEFMVSRSTAWTWINTADVQTYRFVGDRKTYVKREDLRLLRRPLPIESTKRASVRGGSRLDV
jgi:hypothetical protein